MFVTLLVTQLLGKVLRDVQPANTDCMYITLLVFQPLIGLKSLRDVQPSNILVM